MKPDQPMVASYATAKTATLTLLALRRAEGRLLALAARLRRREEVPVVGRQHLHGQTQ